MSLFGKSKSATKRWIVIPDLQVPYEDRRSLAAVEAYMENHHWDGWLCLGDFLDFNELSSYIEGKPGAVQEDVAETFAAGNRILDRQVSIVRSRNDAAKIVLLQGNHDYRAVAYAEKHPGLKKHLDVPANLRLAERGIKWVRSWEKGELYKIGNAYFTHGLLTGKYAASRMVDHYGVCIYFGHCHDVSFHSKVRHGDDKTLEGGSLGCLCNYSQRYMRGAPSAWQQAVTTMFVQPNGAYNLYTSRIFSHRFTGPDGVEYAG
jgi:hypothetical protein